MSGIAQEVAKKFNAMREVSVIMHVGLYDHHDIISPNTIGMPSVVDIIDESCMKTMRQLWLNALENDDAASSAPILGKEETLFDRFESLLKKAMAPKEKDLTAGFVKAAAYPVPPAYAVKLPLHDKGLRIEILSTLVPFQKTRDMLLRLEKVLDAPMRALQIGHTPINDVEALRASGTVVSTTNKLIYN